MANRKQSLATNIAGDFFVDNTCINCDACRRFAPLNFSEKAGFSYVKKQPQNELEVLGANLSLLSCPTGSIGSASKAGLSLAKAALPLLISENIYINGFNSKKSFGADSYFIEDPAGNILIDSPRFTPHLVEQFSLRGGIRTIALTHRDDVADCLLYARHFGSEIFIHLYEGQYLNESLVTQVDVETFMIRPNFKMLFTPGHTEGHSCFLYREKFLFSGDHFAYLEDEKRLGSFSDACWFDWEIQKSSVKILANLTHVEWLLPGHGGRYQVKPSDWPKLVEEACHRM